MSRDNLYKFISDYVYKNTGIKYKEADYYRLDARINTLIKDLDFEDDNSLLMAYQTEITPQMHVKLIDICTNNETFWLRDMKPFKAYANGMLPAIKELYPNMLNLHIWSAASSTGQEPYSIVMATENFAKDFDIMKLRIDASDISSQALAKAKEAVYTGLEVQRGLPAALMVKYFDSDEKNEKWKLKPSVTSKVNFFEFNLLTGNYNSEKYHIIFCRNVLIYQDMENKQKILENLYYSLKPGGFLIFGAGESLIGTNTNFKSTTFEGVTVYQRPME